nr:hypothetical protein [Tanacetum cinerariifolium]
MVEFADNFINDYLTKQYEAVIQLIGLWKSLRIDISRPHFRDEGSIFHQDTRTNTNFGHLTGGMTSHKISKEDFLLEGYASRSGYYTAGMLLWPHGAEIRKKFSRAYVAILLSLILNSQWIASIVNRPGTNRHEEHQQQQHSGIESFDKRWWLDELKDDTSSWYCSSNRKISTRFRVQYKVQMVQKNQYKFKRKSILEADVAQYLKRLDNDTFKPVARFTCTSTGGRNVPEKECQKAGILHTGLLDKGMLEDGATDKLLKDLKELAEYDQSTNMDRPIFLNDNHLENSSEENVVSKTNQKPPQDSDIHQLIEECSVEVPEEQKQKMEDTMFDLVKICHIKQFLCIHDDIDDLIKSALDFKLLSINSINSQHPDKKEQEVKNVEEQQAERRNHAEKSLQNFRIVHKKEIRLIENLLYDNSFPRPPEELNAEIADTIIESIPLLPIPVQDGNSQQEEIDIVTETDDVMPSSVENDDDDYDLLLGEAYL